MKLPTNKKEEKCKHPTGYCKDGYDICGHCGAKVGGNGEQDHTPWEKLNSPHPPHESKGEKLVIVPSGRTDWCGDCKMEHGYECPKSTSPTPDKGETEGWEEEFDNLFLKFGNSSGTPRPEVMNKGLTNIKSFIEKLLSQEKARMREIIEKYSETEDYEYPASYVFRRTVNDIINLIK